jgi:hypothetical protein
VNPRNGRYHRYGGRGIKFLLSKAGAAFLWERDGAAMLRMPSIDRLDNDGDYTLENCRFIEMSENRSRTKKVVDLYNREQKLGLERSLAG